MTIRDDIEEQARGWFVRLNDPDAPEADWLAFQDWIEADPAHRDAYDAVERTWVELDALPPAALPANDEIGRPRPRRWLFAAAGIAAALVLAVGLWPQVAGGGRTYRTDDAPRTVELADGSRIHMNRHSGLTVRMRAGGREVTLAEGEAAFEVARDAARPFVVAAGDRRVQVLGTAFNVVSHDGRFSVSVERGLVAVTPSGGREVRLAAGQRIDQVGREGAVVSRADPALASAWRTGVLVYRDAPLAQVGDDLARYIDKPVTVSASARNLRFTGVLRVGDEAAMLAQLPDLIPVRVSRSPDGVELTRRDAR